MIQLIASEFAVMYFRVALPSHTGQFVRELFCSVFYIEHIVLLTVNSSWS